MLLEKRKTPPAYAEAFFGGPGQGKLEPNLLWLSDFVRAIGRAGYQGDCGG